MSDTPFSLPFNRDPALAIEQAISVFRYIIERAPSVRSFFDSETFIAHELAPALEALRSEKRTGVTDEMVDRFLSWKLPDDFHPDAGINFKREYNEGTPYPGKHQPIGTNLLSATQAKAMLEHVLNAAPHAERSSGTEDSAEQRAPAAVAAPQSSAKHDTSPQVSHTDEKRIPSPCDPNNPLHQVAAEMIAASPPVTYTSHAHRCMSCGARWYCPHQPGNCKADENVFPSLVLPGPDGPTVFHHVCRKP